MRRSWKSKAAILSAVAAVAGAGVSSVVHAGTDTWNVPSGDYGNGSNWSPGLPATGDTAVVSNSGICTISGGVNSSSISLAQLWAGDVSTGTNNGTILQTGGAVTVTGALVTGHAGGSTGIYNMTGGTLSVTGTAITRLFGNITTDPTGAATALDISGSAVYNNNYTIDVGFTNGSKVGAASLNVSGGVLNDGGAITVANGASTFGNIYLSGGLINQSGGGLFLGSGSSATGNMYLSGGTLNESGGNLVAGNVSGSVGNITMTGGTLNQTNTGSDLILGNTTGATGTMLMSGGTINSSAQLWVGESTATSGAGGTGTFILSGGTFNSSNWAVIGRGNTGSQGGSVGVMNITGGTFNHTAGGTNYYFEVGGQGINETATLNLYGGTLITDNIRDESASGTQTINFSGGTIQANANDGGFIGGHDGADAPILNIGNLGATFNTSTYAIGVTLPLAHSGTNPIDGGLTKYGSGTLNLSGGSTYNGPTTVNAGTLNVTGSLTSAITVNASTLNLLGSTTSSVVSNTGSTIGSYNASSTAGGSIGGSLTFTGANTLLVNPTNSQYLSVTGTANASSASVTVTPTINTAPTTATEVLYAAGGIQGTIGGVGSGANYVPGIRGTLSENGADTILYLTAATAGPANLLWTGTNPTHPTYWDVQTTPNWYNNGTGGPDAFYQGDNVTFDDSGATQNVSIQGTSVLPSSVTFNNLSKTYTFTGGAIGGSGSLTVAGGGTVNLDQSNSYTGATNISNGTLAIGTGGSLSLNTAISLGSGSSNGTLRLGDSSGPVSVSVASLNIVGSGSGNVLIGGNASTSTLTVSSSVYVGSTATPTAALTIGAGANLYGNSGSNPSIGIGQTSGLTGTVNLLSGGTLTTNGQDLWIGNGGGVGTLNISGGTLLANGWIAPGRAGGTGTINMTGGSIIKTGGGDLDIAGDGANSHGYFYQTGGTVTTSTYVVIGENNSSEVGVWNLSGGGTSATIPQLLVGSGGNGTMNIFGGGTMNTAGTTIVAQSAPSVGLLTVSGTGTTDTTNGLQALFNGTVNISGGGVVNAVGSNANIIGQGTTATLATMNVLPGGTFNSSSAETWAGNSTTGVGIINDTGAIIVNNYFALGRTGGNGTLNLSGSGSVSVSNGAGGATIVGGDGGGSGSVGYIIQTGGSFNAPYNTVILGEQGGTVSDSGTWNFSGGTATVGGSFNDANINTLGITAGLNGSGTLNINGTAALTSAGLTLGGGSTGNGTFNFNSGSGATAVTGKTFIGLNGTAVANVAGPLVTSSVTVAQNAVSNGTFNLNSGGTLTTAGIVQGNGTAALNINGGTVQANANTSSLIGFTPSVPVQVGSSGINLDSQSFSAGVPASLTGAGGLTKVGSGTITLTGSNSYSGNTTVTAGTLAVGNTNALSSGTVTLANQTTLALTARPATLSFAQFYANNPTSSAFLPVIDQNPSANQTTVTLTTPINNEAVSVFDSNQFTISDTTGFAASFIYNHASQGPEQTGADGVAFVVQSANGSDNTAGGAGGSIGYNGGIGFGQSLATVIDLFLDRLDTGAGNGSNGAFTNVPAENSSPLISQSTSSYVTVVYNGATQTLTETLTSLANGSSTSVTTTGIDAAQLLGGSAGTSMSAYVGFTAATGGANDLQTVSDFTFNPNGTTVLPGSAVAISNSVIVSPSASSTLQLAPTANFSSGAVGPISIGNYGTLAISIGSNASSGVTHGVLTTLSIATGTGATLNLVNNALDITGQSLSSVSTLAGTGFNNGRWNGSGISSSTAASDSTHLTALGVILNSTTGNPGAAALYGSGASLGLFEGANPSAGDVLVKYTYYGDTDLNGEVDGTDYSRIDNGYLNHLTGWFNGDFNYDNVVNGSDYTLIDNAFNSQGVQLASQIASPQAVATDQIAGSGSPASAVPEPTSLGLLAMGAAGLLGRRRRRSSTWLAGAH